MGKNNQRVDRHILCVLLLFSSVVVAQKAVNLKGLKNSNTSENIFVSKIASDKHASSYIIWISDEVKAHKHNYHTEYVYVIKGKGTMILEDKEYKLKKGQLICIPEGTIHSVYVTSRKPLKVLSIQTPEFKGEDRIFVD